ncbi:MAG: MgtC/SapB family protein [Methylocystis sp.]|uniref:MgtC/SapB family protein n=1 Tax=Methylocystis sp. TaxID=1911079 RepID=UPI003DA2EE68
MFEMGAAELIRRLAYALAIGLLIGLERGWGARAEQEGERTAGVRTHGLAALLGGVWGAVAVQYAHDAGAVALGLSFVLFGAVMSAYRYREIEHEKTFGATSVVAMMLAYALGAFAVAGDEVAAAAAAVATTALLAAKGFMHDWVQKLTWDELRSGLVLLVMSFILLPILPDHPVDRWDSVNPHELWLLTVLIATISFAGHVAVKTVGYRRGVAVAGLAGGLASSTATTAAMSRLACEQPGDVGVLAAGALFANAVMGPRVLAVLVVVNPEFGLRLAAPLIAVGVVYLLAGWLVIRRSEAHSDDDSNPATAGNPLDLPAVLKFGALLAAVMILSRILTRIAGSAGVFALAALSGLADVDAISLSMARHGAAEIGAAGAAVAVLIAIVSNTIVKVAMGWVMAGAGMGARLAIASVLALGAGVAALALLPLPSGF